MSGNINKVILVGNLGHDPELRFTSKGNAVMSMSLATHRDIKTADGDTKKETHWHKATVWGKRAERCAQYLKKGSRVYLEGELQARNWKDKEGNNRKNTEILVDEIKFLGFKPQEIQSTTPTEASEETNMEISSPIEQ